jgi:hypothetical protein
MGLCDLSTVQKSMQNSDKRINGNFLNMSPISWGHLKKTTPFQNLKFSVFHCTYGHQTKIYYQILKFKHYLLMMLIHKIVIFSCKTNGVL